MLERKFSKEDIERISEIIDGLECPKDFQCCQAGFEKLCKARYIGVEGFLECLEENPAECKFAANYHDQFFLYQCPLRIFIAEKFKILQDNQR